MPDANQIVIKAIEETRQGLDRHTKQLIIGKGVSFDELERVLYDYRSLLTEASQFPDLRSEIGTEALHNLIQLRTKARSVILSEMDRLRALEEKLKSPFADLFSLEEDSKVPEFSYDPDRILSRKDIAGLLEISQGSGVRSLFHRHPELKTEGTSGTTEGKFIEYISTRQGKRHYPPERISEVLSNFGLTRDPEEIASKQKEGVQSTQIKLDPNQIAEILGIKSVSVYYIFHTNPQLMEDGKFETTPDKLRQYVSSRTRHYTPERKARALAEIQTYELAKPAQPEPEHKIIGDTIDIGTVTWLLQSDPNAVRALFHRHGWEKGGEYGVGKEVFAKYLATVVGRMERKKKFRALNAMGYNGSLDDIRHALGVRRKKSEERKRAPVVPTETAHTIILSTNQPVPLIERVGPAQSGDIHLPGSTKTTQPRNLDPRAAANNFKPGTMTEQDMIRIFEARGWKKDGVYSVETREFARWLANPLAYSPDRQTALRQLGYPGKIEDIWAELGIQPPKMLNTRRCYGVKEVNELFPGLDMQDLTAQAQKRGGYESNRIADWVIASAIERLPDPPPVRITDVPDKDDTDHPLAKNYCDTMEKLIGQAGLLSDPTAKLLSDRMEGTARYIAGSNPCGRELELIRDLYKAARGVAAAGLVDEFRDAMNNVPPNENKAFHHMVILTVRSIYAANNVAGLREYLGRIRHGVGGEQLKIISKSYLTKVY